MLTIGLVLAWDGALTTGAIRCLFGGLALYGLGFVLAGAPIPAWPWGGKP